MSMAIMWGLQSGTCAIWVTVESSVARWGLAALDPSHPALKAASGHDVAQELPVESYGPALLAELVGHFFASVSVA